ncbi:rhodanese-like domain-containing protein [Ferviditalea candida]|uniref:Rhodanese-like domain-containing protein n=1 Tax=Ferviditalea candida TaxID=3108399 RepID=A0ABU5ZEY0_9BACL|nr:rhodanese-like domain-containing protein [Paenibacillaceae bacterium T2]
MMSALKEYAPKVAHDLLKSDHSVVFADIRPEPQFNEAHAVGAINVPYKEETFPQTVKKLLPDEKSLILIGDDPQAVDKATVVLRESGYPVIGFLNWRNWEDERFPATALSEITAQHVNERFRQDKEMVLIDVRSREEWEKEHIPNARNIPLPELEKNIREFNPDQDIVTVCGIGGGRSAAAYSILRRHGFHNARLLKGGVQAWKNENLPVE